MELTNNPALPQGETKLRNVLYCVLFTTIGWTLYVGLMAVAPNPFADDNLRALVRVFIVLLPALIYVRYNQPPPIIDFLQLRQHWLKGLIVGLVIASIYLALTVFLGTRNPTYKIPTSFSSWFNYIIGSPFAEEILYRGVLFQQLNRRMHTWKAMLISALAFAVLHLPAWILIDRLATTQIVGSFAQIFAYGVVFAILLRTTRSLWAPLGAHWLNNLVLSLIVRG